VKETTEIEKGMAEKSSWDQANIRQKLGLVWRNRKKISQIIKDYLYIPFFLLIILCFHLSRREGRDSSSIVVLKCVGRQLQAFLRPIRPEIPKIRPFKTLNSLFKKKLLSLQHLEKKSCSLKID
jgi:hypothetical protein